MLRFCEQNKVHLLLGKNLAKLRNLIEVPPR